MDSTSKQFILFCFCFCICITLLFISHTALAQPDESSLKISNKWQNGVSLYDDELVETSIEEEELIGSTGTRRSLFWGRVFHYHYYISYGALSANRVPCPPRSGRSYYTHNCYRARGPVHPYTRSCSAITRCRR